MDKKKGIHVTYDTPLLAKLVLIRVCISTVRVDLRYNINTSLLAILVVKHLFIRKKVSLVFEDDNGIHYEVVGNP